MRRYDSVVVTRGALYELNALNKQSIHFENLADYVSNNLVYNSGEFLDFEGHLDFRYHVTNSKGYFENKFVQGLIIETPDAIIHLKTLEYQKNPESQGVHHYSDTPYPDYFFEKLKIWN